MSEERQETEEASGRDRHCEVCVGKVGSDVQHGQA